MKLKQLLLSLLALLGSMQVYPYDFSVDGLRYTILSSADQTCEVGEMNELRYTSVCAGHVEIPSIVTNPNDGKRYSVAQIGSSAFADCYAISSITIPQSVIRIKGYALYGCKSLTSITIPAAVTEINEGALENCPSLESIEVNERNSFFDSRLGCNAIINSSTNELMFGCKNTYIPNTVTSIGKGAFFSCTSLTSINIPSSVESIGVNAFYGCSGLTSLTIPSGVKSIGSGAFASCTGLTSISIPETVTSLAASPGWVYNNNPFTGCYNIASITVHPNNPVFDSRNSCNAIIRTADNTLCMGCSQTIIPASVTSIGPSAFSGCSTLSSLTIPIGVTSLGEDAFFMCEGLTSITIPEGVTELPLGTFCGCTSLRSVSLPSTLTTIGQNAFQDCSTMETLYIPQNVSNISSLAFSGSNASPRKSLLSIVVDESNTTYDSRENCNAVIKTSTNELILGCKNTQIPVSVESIGYYAFLGCEDLTSITIPNSVKSIKYYAFQNCSNLTSINIPSSVTSIGFSAFSRCSSLTSVTIPSSVTSIGELSFEYCHSLKEIYCYAEDVIELNDNTFYNVNINNVTLFVCEWVIDAYRNARIWKDFNIKAIPGLYSVYDSMTAFCIDEQEKGSTVKFTHNFNGDWEALYLPFAIDYDAIKTDFDLAEIDGVVQNDDNNDGVADITVLSIMGFKGQTTMPNKPYLIRAKNAGNQTISFEDITVYPTEEATFDCSSFSTKYEFTGSYNTLDASALTNCYIVQNGELVKGASTLSPCRWYMTATARDGAQLNLPNKIRIMSVEDVITGIETLSDSPLKGEDIYNLAGQRLGNSQCIIHNSKLPQGIYIVGGKKILK